MLLELTLAEAMKELPVQLPWVFLSLLVVLGLMVGSFANVVIYRMPRHCLSIVRPSSHCPQCKTPIRWYDNIPVFAWLLWLGRKCRACKLPVPWRYPLVEALCGAWFGVLGWRLLVAPAMAGEVLPWYLFGLWALWACAGVALLIASWIDLEFLIIPDSISLGGTLLVLLLSPLLPEVASWGVAPDVVRNPWLLPLSVEPWLRGLASCAILMALSAVAFWLLGQLGRLLSPAQTETEGTGMGMGDVKLIMLLAGLLGWPKLLICVTVAIFGGALLGLPRLLKKLTSKEEVSTMIPFGPFLSAGACVAIIAPDLAFDLVRSYLTMIGVLQE